MVGTKAANGLGIYDMTGNLWEWCQDWYDKDYYSSSPRDNPQGPSSGTYRVRRGGSWRHAPKLSRTTYRRWRRADLRDYFLGFRLVLTKL